MVINQLKGSNQVNAPSLKGRFQRARDLLRQLNVSSLDHIRRGLNSWADRLANLTMDSD